MDRVLVTGAGGCLGSWVVRQLVDEGTAVVAFDLSEDYRRLRLLLDEDRMGDVAFRRGDLRDFAAVESLVREENITHIVHLAALQIPFCAADPIMGSQVNVAGTVNILEAVRRSEGRVRGTAYASSVAVFGPAEMYEGGDGGRPLPAGPPHPVRRLQAGQRRDRPRLRRRLGGGVGGTAPVHRLRPRTRPGTHLRPDQIHAGRRRRLLLPHRLRRLIHLPARPRRGRLFPGRGPGWKPTPPLSTTWAGPPRPSPTSPPPSPPPPPESASPSTTSRSPCRRR